MAQNIIKKELNSIYKIYHRVEYRDLDPVGCVRKFSNPLDQEVAGLVAAALAYGRVETIIATVEKVFQCCHNDPRQFAIHTTLANKRKVFRGVKHRFHTGDDIALLFESVKKILSRYGSLEKCFVCHISDESEDVGDALSHFVSDIRRSAVISDQDIPPYFSHLIPSPADKSACKRMNMFLRWMVRSDDGIDLGIWKNVSPALLVIPLDVHVARAARMLGMSRRKTNDWKMAQEITAVLRKIDPCDPVKYDFSLCRYGMVNYRKNRK